MQQLNQFRCLCVTQSFGLHFAAVLIADWLLSSPALPSARQNRRAGYRWQGLKPLCGNNLASPRQHLQGACMWLASRNLPSVCRLLTSLLYMCAFFVVLFWIKELYYGLMLPLVTNTDNMDYLS